MRPCCDQVPSDVLMEYRIRKATAAWHRTAVPAPCPWFRRHVWCAACEPRGIRGPVALREAWYGEQMLLPERGLLL